MTTKLITIDEAIAVRLQEKRQEREDTTRREKEKQATIIANEASVAEQARRILSDFLGLDLSDVKIGAEFSHENADGTSYYSIWLSLTEENYCHTNSAVLVKSGISLDPESLLSSDWRGIYRFPKSGNCKTSLYNDLIEAMVFAWYGTTLVEEIDPTERNLGSEF